MTIDATGGNVNLGGTLTNASGGSIAWTGGYIASSATGASLVNQAGATFDAQCDQSIQNGASDSMTVINNGLFEKTVTTGITTIDVSFINTGTVDVETGTLTPGGTTPFTDTGGTFIVKPDATYDLAATPGYFPFTYGGTPSFSGGGTLSLDGGTLAAATGGLTLDAPASMLQWTGGTMTGSVTNTGSITIDATGGNVNLGGTLTNASGGSIAWTGGYIASSATGVSLVNQAGATFDAQCDQSIQNGASDSMTVINNGLFEKTVTTGTTTIGVPFTNTGTVNIDSGTFNTTGAYTQSSGTTNLAGGSVLASSSNVVTISGGVLGGVGTVDGNVSNAGQVIPGGVGAEGILNVSGSYTQSAAGSFTVNLAGPSAGTGYSQLIVSGEATLAGTLNVNLVNGYVPANGVAFQVLDYNPNSGQFATITRANFPTGETVVPSYNATNLTLDASLGTLASISVTPVNPSIALGATEAFTATGTYSNQMTANLTDLVTWSATPSTVATISNASGAQGLASAVGMGSATITATLNGISGTDKLIVNTATTSLTKVSGTTIYGGPATLTATLTATATGAVLSGQTVSFKLDGKAVGSALTNSGGVATLTGVATSDSVGTGSSNVVASFAGTTSYAAITGSGNLTVTKTPLTVVATSVSRTPEKANPTLTYTITGFVNGDTSAVISGTPVLSTTATSASPQGNYPITIALGSLAAKNYTFSNLVNGVLTVGISPINDYTGAGNSDPAVFRRTNTTTAQWFVDGSSVINGRSFGSGSLDVPLAADFTGDGKTDLAVYRPSTGQWFVEESTTNYTGQLLATFGGPNDIPVPANYNGTGKAVVAVYRPTTGQWFFQGQSQPLTFTTYQSGDIPVPGNYDNTGKDEPAIYRPSAGEWIIDGPKGAHTINFGGSTDIPVPGAYYALTTVNAEVEPAVWRPSTGQFFIRTPPGGTRTLQFAVGDIPAPGDYDGVGETEAAVYRPSLGEWLVYAPNATTYHVVAKFGGSGDTPTAAPFEYRALKSEGGLISKFSVGTTVSVDLGATAHSFSTPARALFAKTSPTSSNPQTSAAHLQPALKVLASAATKRLNLSTSA